MATVQEEIQEPGREREQREQLELDLVLDVLPPDVAGLLRDRDDLDQLLEVVLDLGRLPEARFVSGDAELNDEPVTTADLENVIERIGDFGDDNRAGIERTLHRISAIRNRRGQVIGITCRVGRAVFGTIKIIEDLAFSGKNILLLGRPGVGKTTMLREMARVLSQEAKKRVIIVDTSNEIAGDGDVPHPAIGRSRRMQVPTPSQQHGVMIEAVENHMPETIVIDEMGTEQEAAAARTIAERGVQLIATAHGNTLDNLIMNPTLSDLVGGIQTVTLGDQEARYRGTQKSVLERKAPPTFDVVVEIQGWAKLAVHDNVSQVVDQWLRGFPISPEVRTMGDDGEVKRSQEQVRVSEAQPGSWQSDSRRGRGGRANQSSQRQSPQGQMMAQSQMAALVEPEAVVKASEVRIFLFGVGRDKLEAAAAESGTALQIVNELRRADLVLTTKTHYRRGSQLVRIAESSGTPVCVLRKNTMPQLQEFLDTVIKEWHGGGGNGMLANLGNDEDGPPFTGQNGSPTMEKAMDEAEDAANRVLSGEQTIHLAPQRSYIRRLQHLLGQRYNVASVSQGREPERAVLFYRV
ncbi:Putative regulatory protein, contains AAA+ NTPase domain and putative R3H ssDNA-binding domain [hydrothermal vent metagenome]|uniref:Regulatory protein, contains AAA+ NTPase domain and putative R3H ssDNA-binding domain n=1 Tax=hydrothermal vent metagenome TaxID=652676 RepID=A0A170QAP8_9ZZZZ